jgi:hypothetical protein
VFEEIDASRLFAETDRAITLVEKNQNLKLKCMKLEDKLREETLERQKAQFDRDSVKTLVNILETRIDFLIEENERLNNKL